ncbi:MAG TPA: copper resistance CopC family protein [Burkholderiaceae bacterium]|nr:copper resistance CopC family protein [Burkholderiaceae bacterium]
MTGGSLEWRKVALRWLTASAFAVIGNTTHAHAIIVSSQPASGARLTHPAVSVQLRFNSRIDHRRSRFQLLGPDGKSAVLPIETDTEPDVVAASASALKSGSYRLRWQVMSVDGHITRGDIPFDIAR